jgi:hypothetical protein
MFAHALAQERSGLQHVFTDNDVERRGVPVGKTLLDAGGDGGRDLGQHRDADGRGGEIGLGQGVGNGGRVSGMHG